MQLLETNKKDFKQKFETLLNRGKQDESFAKEVVEKILHEVQTKGDKALFEQIEKFDKWKPKSPKDLLVSKQEIQKAYDKTPKDLIKSLEFSLEKVIKFHKKQLQKTWLDFDSTGTVLGQKITPVNRAGLYVPGGKAAYPSSLIMNIAPAVVAGVKNISLASPAVDGVINPSVLAAAKICGLDSFYKMGGASAIGAFAYGTKSIEKCDVITGPGNIFVATAKKMVYGDVNIDMIAGPSEICVVADENANAKYAAIDLLSQAEHDEMASCILVTHSKELYKKIVFELQDALKKTPRKEIAAKSIQTRGAVIITKDEQESIEIVNLIAPEHLEVMLKNPMSYLPFIQNAGAIFLGEYTPEAIGDYVAGPNHTLPTGASARFFSPLGVDNFMKKSSIIYLTKEGLKAQGVHAAKIAKHEGLFAHEQSIKVRI